MNRRQTIFSLMLAAALAVGAHVTPAQQSFKERFIAHNNAMTALQPAFVTPLVEADPRLLQYVRASFSQERSAAGTETVNYGNCRGGGVIAGNRFEFDYVPPSYIQHNSSAVDGLGDTSALVKYRVASGNAEHGNFAVAAILSHSFATGTYKNGAATDTFGPMLAAGYAFLRRFDVQSSLGGVMPTGKIATQGRTIAGNMLAQARANNTFGSRWRTTPHSTLAEYMVEKCRTSSPRQLSMWRGARSGSPRIPFSSWMAVCRSQLLATTPITIT
jgi:hypothetical protein